MFQRLVQIAGLGLVLRLVWVWQAAGDPVMFADPWIYLRAGRALAEGSGYINPISALPTAYYPPGYPLFLGAIGSVLQALGALDKLLPVALFLQAFLSAASIVVWALLAERLWNQRVATIAAVLLATYPNLVLHSGVLLSETLFVLVLGLAMLTLLGSKEWPGRPSSRRLVLHGLLLGLAILIRPQSSLYIAPVVLAWAWLLGPKRTIMQTALTLAVALTLVAPWTLRNTRVFGEVVPISTNNGENLCIGYNPDAGGGFGLSSYCDTGIGVWSGAKGELERDRRAAALARQYLLANLGELPSMVFQRLKVTLRNDHDALDVSEDFGQRPWLPAALRSVLETVSDGAWFALAIAAFLASFWVLRTPAQVVLIAGALTTLLPILAVFGDARFKLPMIPALLLVAAAGLERLLARRGRSETQP